uniref:GPI ethanolamine phosphate transferase 3 n=3 Tax=Ascarididae TaxID=6250 RepID=A0A915AER8_PARUN
MNSSFAHFLNIVLLSLCFIIALLLFQHGFLLKRHEVHTRSSCSDVTVTRSACWLPARYQRAVILLVDALRYDFVALQSSSSSQALFSGRLPSVTRLLRENNESAVLMHFIADPPTTTMQRLKALTTGSLPTFIDVGSNFASTAIVEDNWVEQIVSSGRNITFLGDDTWISLFPSQFHRHFDMPSFDVNDLNSVDDMIIGHIFEELSRSDWNVLIAHFLGVDHCGHKYGPNHEEMARRLAFIDDLISNVTEILDEETVLIVMGDHGMTETGDHGGDTELETDAAIFIYSRKRLLFTAPPKSISQIDLVPTLSVLLDSPIPFSNVGVLVDCFIAPELLEWAKSSNAWQMVRYAQSVIVEMPQIEPLLRVFDSNSDNMTNQQETMRQIQAIFRASWTNFNMAFMRVGILSFVDTLLTTVNAFFSKSGVSLGSLVFRSGVLFVQCSAYLVADDERYIAVLDALLSVSLIWRAIIAFSAMLALNFSLFRILTVLMLVVHAFSYFSNSYIVFESISVRFLAQSAFVVAVLHSACAKEWSPRKSPSSLVTLIEHRIGVRRVLLMFVVLTLLRGGAIWERCREEQQNACTATQFSVPLTRLSFGAGKVIRFVFGVSILCISSLITYRMQRERSPEMVSSSLIFPATVATVAVWTAQWLPDKSATQFASFSLVAAQIVYVLTGVRIVMTSICAFQCASLNAFVGCALAFMDTLSSALVLLLGDALAMSFFCIKLIIYFVVQLVHDEYQMMVVLTLLSSHGFFALSHQATFSTIPWQAAFIGVPGNFAFQSVPAALVGAHLFASYIITVAALPLSLTYFGIRMQSRNALAHRSYMLLMFSALSVLCTCMAAVVHRRHLMVWKVFAPKFIFESISFCVVCSFVVITNLIFCSLNSLTVSLPLHK